MKCTLTVRMDNSAFDDSAGAELARILRDVATKLGHTREMEEGGWNLRDINGNTCGEITFADYGEQPPAD